MFLNSSFRSNRGISLLELMLSLLVIAIVLLSATRYFMVANENTRVAQAAQMINAVVEASYKWVEGVPNFGGSVYNPPVSISALRNAGLLPSNYINPKNNSCALNPWKDDLCVAPAHNVQKIEVTLQGVPVKSCTALREKLNAVAPDANCLINISTQRAKFTATF